MSVISATRFELCRLIRPYRVACCLLGIVLIGALSYQDLSMNQMAAGGALEGSTSWDVFYLAINNEVCTGVVFPIVCLVLAGDAFSQDAEHNMAALLLVRGGSRRSYWLAKCLAVAVICLLYSVICCAVLTLFDHLAFGTSLGGGGVPTWFAYSGDTDEYYRQGATVFSLIPETWNYPLLIGVLALFEGIVCSAVTLFFAAVCVRTRLSILPLVMGFCTIILLQVVQMVGVKLTFLLSGASGEAAFGVPDIGFVLDRLSLSTYALGAGLLQTGVGGPAIVAHELSVNPGPYAEGYLEALGEGYAVNSFASFFLLVFLLLAFSLLFLSRAGSFVVEDDGRKRVSTRFFTRGGDRHV